MANMTFKTNLLPNSDLEYSLGSASNPTARWKIYGEVQPLISKTYSAYTCSADNEAKGVLFFGKVNITNSIWQAPWSIHYRLYVSTTEDATQGEYDCYYSVCGSTVNYYIYNNFYSTSYRPIYNHRLLYPKDGYNSYGGYIGVRVSTARRTTTLARTFTIEILETKNCTVELNDSIKRFDETYITTNSIAASTIWYNTDFNGTSEGLQETGDIGNDTGYYILTNGFRGTADTTYKLWRYCLFARSGNNIYESFTGTSGTATNKTKNPHGFLPEGKIYWNSASGTDYSGTITFSPYQQYHSIDYRYSFNIETSDIPANANTYLKWTYNDEDGLLYLADSWLATALPTTEDGFIYQRIGSNYYGSADYRASLLLDNPYYIYKNSSIQVWTPPQNTVVTTGDGNAVTGVSISGSTITVTKDASYNNYTYTLPAATSGELGGIKIGYTTSNKKYAVQLDTNGNAYVDVPWTDNNTWRGIQDNLTSDSATDSLSAKQGKALANGSARDSTKLPLAGGTMTGAIKRYYSAASTDPVIAVAANNQDATALWMGHGTAAGNPSGNYYKFLYKGTSSSPNNYFQLIAGVNSSSEVIAMQVNEQGNVSFTNTVEADISGNAATATAVTQKNQTDSNDYRILLSGSANDTDATEGTNKSTNLCFNPSTKVFSVGGDINATGDLTITGNANLNSETYVESITAGSLLVNGAANFVNIPTAPTPETTSNDTSIATTAFVMNAFTANDAMVFKGVINANSDLPADYEPGWTYRIGTAGEYENKKCEVGDIIIGVPEGTAANNDHWAVIQNNIDGAVYKGTDAFTDANIIIADSTAGKVKSSGKTITTTAPSSGSANTTIPTSKAVWSAISGASGYGKTGTVTSVQVQASSPLQSSTNTAQTATLNTTISFANQNANTILAGPSSGSAAAPTFRSLVAADHYAPIADSSAALSVDASSTTAATWNSTSLVTGVNIQRDAKGHVTGVTVDSVKMPTDPNVDTKVNVKTRDTTKKAYIMADATAPTATAAAHEAVAETAVYMDTTAGAVAATSYKIAEKVILQYNTTTNALDFVFV